MVNVRKDEAANYTDVIIECIYNIRLYYNQVSYMAIYNIVVIYVIAYMLLIHINICKYLNLK